MSKTITINERECKVIPADKSIYEYNFLVIAPAGYRFEHEEGQVVNIQRLTFEEGHDCPTCADLGRLIPIQTTEG